MQFCLSDLKNTLGLYQKMMGDQWYITNNDIFFLTLVSEKLSSKSVELLL